MTAVDLLRMLGETTLAGTAAVALVLLLRGGVRRFAGSGVAYALWAMVPAAIVAVLLPAPVRLLPAVSPGSEADGGVFGGIAPLAGIGAFDGLAPWLLAAWFCGALFCAVAQTLRQRRFVEGLGRLRPRGDGLWQAQSVAGLPAAVGLRPRIVIPADLDTRYSAREQRMTLAHERCHVRRGDVAWNALAAGMHCLYWFNPLVAFAIDRFRRDQELACDEAVLRRHPGSCRTYAEALLKTQLSAVPAPLACQWPGHHPLKERIAMLSSSRPSARRLIAGAAFVLAATAATGYAAWAAQPQGVVKTGGAQQAWPVVEGMPVATPPAYPAEALAANIGGKVSLLVDVAPDGSVSGVEVESATPPGVFDTAALEAAKHWKFTPPRKHGKPVAGRVRVPVVFEPDERSVGGAQG